jgi:hypothetical protein
MDPEFKPALRNINVQQTIYQGEPVFVMQDSLRLTDAVILLPQALGPLAILCDGEHTVPQIEAALAGQFGLKLPRNIINNLLEQFDQALLLESDTFRQAREQVLTAYRTASFREPALAGPSYPADPADLRRLLQSYLDGVNGLPAAPANSRGLISPHIDFQRGGPVYAQVWASAAQAVREAELAIIFGTDHNGSLGTLTLTRQNYASPLGVMPTDTALVDRLAAMLGPDHAFAEELHHRGEHSIELALVWLQFMRQSQPCQVLPVLTGSFHHFMAGMADVSAEKRFDDFITVLRHEAANRRTVVIAAGDLAHLGPAFDGPPLDGPAHAQMKTDDDALINTLCAGDAAGFLKFMQAGQFQRNVCGLAPFYFTLSVLNQSRGQTIAYDRCLADNNNSSFVSVCGMVFQ